jgi:periplasmic protein TonB
VEAATVNAPWVTTRRPPLVGVAVAVGLHLAFLVSVQITSTKNSVADVAFAKAAVMVVRSLEAATAPAATEATDPSKLPPASASLPATSAISLGAALPVPASQARPSPAPVATAVTQAPVLKAALALPAAPPSPLPVAPSSELPAAPQYRAAGSLDPGPKPLSDINPDYPTRAGQQQGIVVLRLLINEQGLVDNVAVVRAAPAGYFEESALEAFGKALFSPGKLLGVAVKSQITIEVEFMPINRGATVSGRTY